MKVDGYFVEVDTPDGKQTCLECAVCSERFFDRVSRGVYPRVLESGVSKFIDHANNLHGSTGGTIGAKKNNVAA